MENIVLHHYIIQSSLQIQHFSSLLFDLTIIMKSTNDYVILPSIHFGQGRVAKMSQICLAFPEPATISVF